MSLARYAAVFAIALAVYGASAATTVQWGDSARLSQQIRERDLSVHLGIGGHPLHTAIGIGTSLDPNLLSALLGAIAVAFIAAASHRLGGSPWLAAALLGASHTHWYLASLTESYTLASAMLAAACWAMSGPSPFAAGLLLGVSPLGNAVAAMAWPGFALWGRNRPSFFAGSALGGLITIAVYGSAFNVVAVSGTYAAGSQLTRGLLLTPVFLLFQFASPVLLQRPRFRREVIPLLIGAACIVLFAAMYIRQKQFNLLIGANVLLALALSLVYKGRLAWLHAAWMAALYFVSPVAAPLAEPLLKARPAPGRDAAYFLQPWKCGRDEAAQWAERALMQAPPNAVIIADYTLMRVLRYINTRSDLRFEESDWKTPQTVLAFVRAQSRPVVLAQDYEPYYFVAAISEEFTVEACGVLFCVRRP